MFVIFIVGNLTNGVVDVGHVYYSDSDFYISLVAFADIPQFLCRGLNIFVYYKYNFRYKEIFDRYTNAIKCFRK